jgi:hypothetical protein
MHHYDSPEILISVLRSTSFLLQHYGYTGHDPSLSELQRSLGLAISQLEIQMRTEGKSPEDSTEEVCRESSKSAMIK